MRDPDFTPAQENPVTKPATTTSAAKPSAPAAPPATIEEAFDRKRAELGVRGAFPDEVLREAEEAAKRDPAADGGRVDRTEVEFVTIDPPGSRDLDQALHIERTGDGLRVRYAIADVGFFVDRGGAVEKEAWLRGLTSYAPDRKVPLYPESLSQGAASLLPDQLRPALLFEFALDARGELVSGAVERALVRSRAQLTYAQALEHIESGGETFRGEAWGESVALLKSVGELRMEREKARGGVSLPLLSQRVQQSAASKLGYALDYEQPTAADEWNAQVSLLTGHFAAETMLAGKIGMLRTMPGAEEERIRVFRQAARALGFRWPDGMEYGEFIRSVPLDHKNATALFWQAKRVMRGSDYVAFDGAPPEEPLHHALAMHYAHATAPLRRLGDRYVLDLVAGGRPDAGEGALLERLAKTMNELERTSSTMERAVVDIAEAWTLRGREGERFSATLLGVRGRAVEVQIEEPPVRVEAARGGGGAYLKLGQPVTVRLEGVSVEEGEMRFVLEE